jgi:hypothetical protein
MQSNSMSAESYSVEPASKSPSKILSRLGEPLHAPSAESEHRCEATELLITNMELPSIPEAMRK